MLALRASQYREPLRTKAEVTRSKIIDAAARVVAREGYPRATIAKIAAEADIAFGLFYYYFPNKEALFGELLPEMGSEMIAFISDRTAHLPHDIEREIMRFEAYFEFLAIKPEFNRVFTEAQVFVPNAYAAHMSRVMTNYIAALEQHRKAGALAVKRGALKPLAYALIGIRNYMTQLVASRDPTFRSSPAELTAIYRTLLSQGVFSK